MKLVLGLIAVVTAVSASLVAVATAGQGHGRPALPPGAVEVSEGTYFLGTKKVDGVELQGYAFVHRRSPAKPNAKPGGGTTSTCYSLLASGAKWKTLEGFKVNTTNAPAGVADMVASMNADVGTWEAANAADANIFGDGQDDSTYHAILNVTDGKNGAEFGPIADTNVIAVTYTWGIFSGPARNRVLVEWDMLFDVDDFDWATDGSADAMDFENIATHELGHAMGLGHPSGSCTEETMYAYATEGETKKRDLNTGDVAGINVMY